VEKEMKNLLMLLVCTSVLLGCSATKEFFVGIDEDAAIIISSRILAREIGCEVKMSGDPELDRSLRNVYDLAATGELTQDAMNQLNEQLGKTFDNRPTLIANILDLTELVGVRFNPEGQAIGLEEVSPKLFEAVSKGYVSGFGVCVEEVQ
jgi:hypothetical protein